MTDAAHNLTDERLAQMEKHIAGIYSRAAADIQKTADKYFAKFAKQDDDKRKLLESGRITEEEYTAWRKNKLMYGERFTKMKEQCAQQILHANETALAYVNGNLPEVYALNYNALESSVDGVGGYSFTLVDADTVRNLATSDESLLPYREIDPAKDIPWNTKHMNAEVLQGILQGESMGDIAGRLAKVVGMDETAAIRNARTMVTSAECKGRQDSYIRAQNDGILMQRRWIATKDARTRHWHAELDGALTEVDEPFENAIGKIMYPGDPSADGANVYNCRCTIVAKVLGFKKVSGNVSANPLTPSRGSGIMYTGARITNIFSDEATSHAALYYEEIRNMQTDVEKIAKVTGKTLEQIQEIKDYLFINESFYDEDLDENRRFDPDFSIAQSWQRLLTGENISHHDLTLIEHELFEIELKKKFPTLTHEDIHKIASDKYNYSEEAKAYYANSKKHNEE